MGQRDGRGAGRRAPAWALAATVVAGVASTAATVPAGAGTPARTVLVVTDNHTWGRIVTLADGRTVYRLAADPRNRSVCRGQCAVVWPPVVLGPGQTRAVGHGISGLGTITRPGGARQVTLDGAPLYLFDGDHRAGQVNGDIKDTWGQWWVVDAAHPRQVPSPLPAMSSGSSSQSTAGSTGGTGVAY